GGHVLHAAMELDPRQAEPVDGLTDCVDANDVDEEVRCEIAAGRDHVERELAHGHRPADRRVHDAVGVTSAFHAKRLPVDDAEEAVADMNTGMRLELTALDRVIYAEQDRHLDGAGRMEPPFRVEAPLDAVVEVVEGNGDVLR